VTNSSRPYQVFLLSFVRPAAILDRIPSVPFPRPPIYYLGIGNVTLGIHSLSRHTEIIALSLSLSLSEAALICLPTLVFLYPPLFHVPYCPTYLSKCPFGWGVGFSCLLACRPTMAPRRWTYASEQDQEDQAPPRELQADELLLTPRAFAFTSLVFIAGRAVVLCTLFTIAALVGRALVLTKRSSDGVLVTTLVMVCFFPFYLSADPQVFSCPVI